MKTSRIIASAFVLLVLALLLSQSAGVGAQSAPNPSAAQFAVPSQPANGFSARLTRPNDQAPYQITFQGRLTDHSGNPITTAINLTFRLYTVPSGGNPIFNEGPQSVTPNAQGLLTYQVGSLTAINAALIAQFANSLYLGVTVASDAEMTPRLALTAAPYALSLAPGAVVSGNYSGVSGQYGVVNAINTNLSGTLNAGLYAEGATAVWGEATSTGTSNGSGGYFNNNGGGSGSQTGVSAFNSSTNGIGGAGGSFTNYGGGSGSQYGVIVASPGYGVYAYSGNGTPSQQSTGVVGLSNGANGFGGVFTDIASSGIGVAAVGSAAAGGSGGRFKGYDGILADGRGANQPPSNDGLDVGGIGTTSYAIYSTQPSGDTNYTLNGAAHIRGSNITAASYEVEVRYHGSEAAQIGDVLALDGSNETVEGSAVLGVVKADANNSDAAVGVLAYRLDTSKVNGLGKTYIDGSATQVNSGDRAYIVVVGEVRMKVSGTVKIGSHVALSSNGTVTTFSGNQTDGVYVGKVASRPDSNGNVTVFVNLK